MKIMKDIVYPKGIVAVAGVVAVLPEYSENGDNMCRVYFGDGSSRLVPYSITQFIIEWLDTYDLTLPGVRLWARSYSGYDSLNPIVINKDIVLVPFKARPSYSYSDETYGYVSLTSISTIDSSNITLHNGRVLPYLSRYDSLRSKILCARLLRYEHIEYIRSKYSDY